MVKVKLPQRVQPAMRCYRSCDIMALLDDVTGAVFIVDAFNAGNIFLSIRIAQRSIPPNSQLPKLYRPLLSAHNTVSPPLNFSPLSVNKTVTNMAQFLLCLSPQLCIAHAQILPSLGTQHSSAHRSIPPLSAHKTASSTVQILPSLTTTLYRPPLKFSPLSAQYTVSPKA